MVDPGAAIVVETDDTAAPGVTVANKVPPQLPLKNSTVPRMLIVVGKFAVSVIVAGAAFEQ